MNMKYIGVAGGLLVLLSGCADVYEPTPKISAIQSDKVISSTAALSHIFVRDPKSTYAICSQPAPDAAFDQGESADVSFSLISSGQNDATDESESSSEVEMAGRTPTVLMTRELFFRACEFSQNYKLSKQEALALYNKTLDLIRQNWATEAGNTTVTIGDTVTTTNATNVTDSEARSATSSDTISNTSTESSSSESTTSQ